MQTMFPRLPVMRNITEADIKNRTKDNKTENVVAHLEFLKTFQRKRNVEWKPCKNDITLKIKPLPSW